MSGPPPKPPTQPMQDLRPVHRAEAPSPPVVRRRVKICLACARRQWQGRVHIHPKGPNHDLTKARTNPPPPNPTAPSSYSIGDPTNSTFRARALVLCVVSGRGRSRKQVISRARAARNRGGLDQESGGKKTAHKAAGAARGLSPPNE